MASPIPESKGVGVEYVHEDHAAIRTAEQTKSEKEEQLVENLEYADDEHQPKLHLRTYVAMLALCLQSFCQLWSLLGPPSVLSIILASFPDGPANQAWVVTALVIVQGVFCTALSQYSDLFQARKALLVGGTTLAFVGATIAPGAQTVGRLIAAQALIGGAFAVQTLTFVVPSEILPTKWRPMAQGLIQATGALGMVASPLSIGALCKRDMKNGWRNFYWISAGLWAASAIFLFVGYRPPPRRTQLDHLSTWQKIRQIDLVGAFLIAAGLCLLPAGLNMGGEIYPWTSAAVLSTLIIGIVMLVLFGLWEWKGTKTGILHHELFTHSKSLSTFGISIAATFAEGILAYAFIISYPLLTHVVYETDILKVTARVIIYYASAGVGFIIFGYMCVKLRSIREALIIGFACALVAIIGMATVEPHQNANPMIFAALGGVGTAASLSQTITGVQLASPHSHMSAATAVAVVARSIAITIFTSIYSSVVHQKLDKYLPTYIAEAAEAAGLPQTSVPTFVADLIESNTEGLASIAGVSPVIVAAGVKALKQAYADALRYPYIIAAPFMFLMMIGCWWLGDIKQIMNYHVDAPVEVLRAKDEDGSA